MIFVLYMVCHWPKGGTRIKSGEESCDLVFNLKIKTIYINEAPSGGCFNLN